MRSVRALDVLFTAQAAVNLLSRVAASQATKICAVQDEPVTEISQQEATKSNTAELRPISDAQPIPSSPLPTQEDLRDAQTIQERQPPVASINLSNISDNGPVLSRQEVKKRYTKPPSALFRSIDPSSLDKANAVGSRYFIASHTHT